MDSTEGSRLGTEAARRLAAIGYCEIAPGLSEAEFGRIESDYGFEFSADHRAFLAAGLPVAQPFEEGATWEKPWPDWRDGDPDELRERLRLPIESALDPVRNGWWPREWGARPARTSRALAEAEERLARVPLLVPLYAHRFVPAGRDTWGLPVLSIVGGLDVVCYGRDLAHYVDREFGELDDEGVPPDFDVAIPFWRDHVWPRNRPTGATPAVVEDPAR